MKKMLLVLLLACCSAAVFAQSITGPTSFCTSTATYTISGAPAGATVVWSIDNNSVATISPSGASVTVTRVAFGYAWLGATVNGTVIPSRGLVLGSITTISAIQSGECHDGKMTWTLNATPTSTSASNWQWTVDDPSSGSYYISSPNSPNTFVTVQGGGYVSVSYTDACGYTSMYSGALVYSPCAALRAATGAHFTAYPNPANTQLNIEYANQPDSATTQARKTATGIDVKLYNEKGYLLRSASGSNDRGTLTLDASTIPEGTYYLHVLQNGEKVKKQIVIKH